MEYEEARLSKHVKSAPNKSQRPRSGIALAAPDRSKLLLLRFSPLIEHELLHGRGALAAHARRVLGKGVLRGPVHEVAETAEDGEERQGPDRWRQLLLDERHRAVAEAGAVLLHVRRVRLASLGAHVVAADDGVLLVQLKHLAARLERCARLDAPALHVLYVPALGAVPQPRPVVALGVLGRICAAVAVPRSGCAGGLARCV
eukprot:511968-Pleurochrysis_carterae.AAC.1